MNDHIRFDEASWQLLLLDQRRLPMVEETFVCRTVNDVVYALQTMVVRGAPAIGVTAAYGCCLALPEVQEFSSWRDELATRLRVLAEARPTAVNLRWAVDRMQRVALSSKADTPALLRKVWLAEAKTIHLADVADNQAMGRFGAVLLRDGDRVLTHCNAGALATAGYGTALGVIRAAVEAGKKIEVIADETRPFLQGARLTAYELHRDGIPVRVACDNAAALLMRKGLVDKVIVGADRIAANGDAANKIGTYGVALLAKAHGIPFFVAAPLSTIDPLTATGDGIPIEERPAEEVVSMTGIPIVPENVPVYNFAFDVTPAELISAIITEVGVLSPPFGPAIAQALSAYSHSSTYSKG